MRIHCLSLTLSRESITALMAGALLALHALLWNTPARDTTTLGLYVFVMVGSIPLAYEIITSLLKRHFGVDIIAITAIISTLAIGEVEAAAVVLLMLSGGESLERFAQGRARSALSKLIAGAPTTAHKITPTGITDIHVQSITQGDKLVIRPNEIVPIDGIVDSGNSSIDESMITGEPLPRDVRHGNHVWSGSVNQGGVLEIHATTTHETSTYAALIRLVKQAEEEKAPTVRLADRSSVWFTLTTFILAGIGYSIDPRIGAAVLVVATPCPLILAAPIAFIAGMSRSARRGIIVKHGGVFEAIERARVFLFDKTGTLTYGTPEVNRVFTHSSDIDTETAIAYAGALEQYSNHVLAQGIASYARATHKTLPSVESVQEILGKGVTGIIHGAPCIIGKISFLHAQGVSIPASVDALSEQSHAAGETIVHLAMNQKLCASFTLTDHVRGNTRETITRILAQRPQLDIALATGDTAVRAHDIGKTLGFTTILPDLLPEGKVDVVTQYQAQGKPVVMIGDGVNDAPALASASAGIAMGAHGATAATDSADAIILIDDIGRIEELTTISRNTMRIARESMFWGMGLSGLAMIVALTGNLPPLYGAILQEGIDIIVILNALRALR